jgi:zinc finger CCCH domain-containing protein 13
LRRERDDRERPRSRVRDSSRQRRDTSPTRRERELDRDRDRDRDEHRRRDGRDRDLDRDTNDDPRRWRDDGKRDERIAARRELRDKEFRERERDREKERGSRVSERESNWESDRNRDRERDRWVTDERDSRSKRPNGRDRPGHSRDEDRDERKDSRVRVEEKEPAWMDTYIPNESGVGIFGGQAENGELDGIQAWKLGMKEKERKERESDVSRSSSDAEHASGAQIMDSQAVPPADPQLDEIQLFKLMIKREEEKNKAASLKGPMNDPAVAYLIPGTDTGMCLVWGLFAYS